MVAAAWAMTAGWVRTVGQVTPVVMRRPVVVAIPPATAQTNGAWPCASFHGWKWSDISRSRKPACSPIYACSTRALPPCSSAEMNSPMVVMARD